MAPALVQRAGLIPTPPQPRPSFARRGRANTLALQYYTPMHRDSGAAFYEFFAGGGLARLGLEPAFACAFANDIDPAKGRAYEAAHGKGVFQLGDVWSLNAADLPGCAALAWASFPCQDLSLAGARGGLAAPRSGTFWGYWRLIEALAAEDRAPETLVLENVTGLLTSHGGADFSAIVGALTSGGYRVGALEIDAAHFTPQSRARVFIVATRASVASDLVAAAPSLPFHSPALVNAVGVLPEDVRANWLWWRLPAPAARNTTLADILDRGENWDDQEKTNRLLGMMSPAQRARVLTLKKSGATSVGALFRRIRVEDGKRVQRAEARFDGLAGCLRTPAGGSSRQTLLVIDRGIVRSRLISPREAARLMGVSDAYPLPRTTTDALHLFGDGVCVSAVKYLSDHLLAPLAGMRAREAA